LRHGLLPSSYDSRTSYEVHAEAGALIADSRAAGWIVTASSYEERAFGDWIISLKRGRRQFQFVKNQSQFLVMDPSATELRTAGMLRVVYGPNGFREAGPRRARHDRIKGEEQSVRSAQLVVTSRKKCHRAFFAIPTRNFEN